MFIYVIVCVKTLKLYVGQTKKVSLTRYLQQKWWQAHHYSAARSHLLAAMRKHPRDSWSIHPLVSGVESKAELDELEKHFIRVLKAQHPDVGYNICDGGEGHTGPHTEKWKQSMRLKMKGHSVSAETRAKIAKANLGNKNTLGLVRGTFSVEFRHKLSEAAKRRWARSRTSGMGC